MNETDKQSSRQLIRKRLLDEIGIFNEENPDAVDYAVLTVITYCEKYVQPLVDSQALEIERLKKPLNPRFNNSTIQDRSDDMGGGVLRLAKQEDGDICLSIHRRIGMLGVEFCSTYMGGGKSPETLNALRNLFIAMEQDNKNSPQVDITEDQL